MAKGIIARGLLDLAKIGGITAGVGGTINALDTYGKSRKRALAEQGPNPIDKTYDLRPLDNLFTGGNKDREKRRGNYLANEFSKTDIPSLIKADPTLPQPGKNQTVQQYESANPERLRSARLAQKAKGNVEVAGIVNKAVEQSPEFQRNEARYEDEIAYRNNLLLQNRLDQQDRYAQELKLLGMQQTADQDRYKQNLELYREDQKQGQINNLVAGLVALSAAFAV